MKRIIPAGWPLILAGHTTEIINAIVQTLAFDIVRPPRVLPGSDEFAAAFVRGQVERMPQHLRIAMRVLARTFDMGAVVRFGRPFRRLDHARRARYLALWERAPVGPLRDLIRFHRSLLIFALYSRRVRGG